jgi:two-component system CheB/CheR fusion protein
MAPPSILVDQTQRVLHLSEHAGRYLQPSGGTLSGDVVDLVRPELRFELRSALHRLFERGQTTLTLPIPVQFNGLPHRVHLQVKAAEDDNEAKPRNALVLFLEGEAVESPSPPTTGPQPTDPVRQLREELELTQARLKTTREESEAVNEELRASNEELQSINEEYRSTSEELETSKEELQSINEELQTVNNELKLKLDAVSRAHSDLQNLMAATDFGTLFLDSSLRIKRFTAQVTELFRITPSDEGRPVTDFAHQLDYDDLVTDAQAVLRHLTPIKREVRGRNDRWYDIRLRPYRTVDDKIDGVVITFVDITESRRIGLALTESERLLGQEKRLVELSREPIFIWDYDGGLIEWNRGCQELYGYSREEALGRKKDELLATKVPGSSFAELRAKLLTDGSWSGELKNRAKDGRELTVESRIVLESTAGRRLALESIRDVTERRLWEQRQQLLLRELTHRVKNTLAVVQAIAHQTMRSRGSIDDLIGRFDGRLAALANTHNILIDSEWKGADLRALALTQLEPFAVNGSDRVQIEGEPISLPANLATPFGLTLHELATNATKYGALSGSEGTVNLSWTMSARNGQRLLTLLWRESNGPTAKRPRHTGFGSALIEKGLPEASVKREFRRDGLVCTIELPLDEATEQ